MNRCGNCMAPHHVHQTRMEAAPLCPDGKGVYREATEAELDAAYKQAFPNGPVPIASFDLNDPASAAKARELLGPDAMRRHFGPGGGGMDAFEQSLKDAAK